MFQILGGLWVLQLYFFQILHLVFFIIPASGDGGERPPPPSEDLLQEEISLDEMPREFLLQQEIVPELPPLDQREGEG